MPEEKKKSWIKRHWIISSILGFFLLLIVIGMFQGISESATGNAVQEETQKEVLPASYEEAKQKSVTASYEDLMRYPESYEGKWVCFEGQVVQVMSNSPNFEIRVSTKEEEMSEYWDGEPLYIEDVVYVQSSDYSGERLLEEDIIQFCGRSKGVVEYTAIMGNKISIPEIETDDTYVRRAN